jgi:hypothetical protein
LSFPRAWLSQAAPPWREEEGHVRRDPRLFLVPFVHYFLFHDHLSPVLGLVHHAPPDQHP